MGYATSRIKERRSATLNALDRLARGLAYLAVVFAVAFSIAFYGMSNELNLYGFRAGQFSNGFGALSVFCALVAVSIWVARKVYLEVKRRQLPDFQLARTTLLFLRRHHILLGWATIFTATAHALYYLLHDSRHLDRIYTGLFTWSMLACLVIVGSWLDFKLKSRQKSKQVRLYHMALALMFLAGMIVHVF